jgi:hypothetical protein
MEMKMATQNHTPGPWKTNCLHIERQNGQSIAATVHDSWQTEEEELANARLIAAAPELLEALQQCVGLLSVAVMADGATSLYGSPVTQKARAAIAKATK